MQSKRVVVADTGIMARHQLVQAINRTQSLTVVAETNDGEELLALSSQCDIVVMDLILGSIDGLEVLDQLRALPVRPIILVLSSFAVERVAKLSIDRGADYLMLKPYKVDSVVKRILQLAQPVGAPLPQPEIPGLKAAVSCAIHEIGIPSHIKGYQYLRDAIMMAVEDMEALDCITKILYPKIAKDYATTACGVERAIRHAIEIAWERADPDTLQCVFGSAPGGSGRKPTNSEFIALIADKLQLQLKSAEVGNF